MQRKIKQYGWRPDLPDYRDLYYKDVHAPEVLKAVVAPDGATAHTDSSLISNVAVTPAMNTVVTTLPTAVTLRPHMPPVMDQGQLGSCTAHAASAMWTYVHGGGPYSRLQIYYNERAIENDTASDSGAQLRDAIQVLVNVGAGLEQDWPYDVTKFALAPPAVELTEAAQNKATVYSRLENGTDFRNCLAQGFPFIIGIAVYSSFETQEVAATGIVPMPQPGDSQVGGHAICVIGYNDNFQGSGKSYYEIRNSWGEDFGDAGNVWLPAEYLENPNLATDSWTIRK